MNTQKKIIPSNEILTAVNGLSQLINPLCEKYGGGIVFICVMKGGFMFFSDLIKKINYPIEVDFIKCSSYDGQEQLIKMYPLVFNMCAEHGYNMTGRDHIIAFDTQRMV